MRAFLGLCGLCYCLFFLLPLPKLHIEQPTPPPTEPSSSPQEPIAEAPYDAESFKVLDADAGVIYTFSKRDFLIYTVASEMPASFPTEALKAQAVASYTYYLNAKEQNKNNANL